MHMHFVHSLKSFSASGLCSCRFGAPLYVNKDVAEQMGQKLNLDGIPQPELPADVEVTCRAVLKRYHDPTFLHKINMQVAVQEDRFEDAAK